MSGLDHIERVFAARRPALMPYFTLGYPDIPTSLAIVQAIAESGADMLELGIPFSDPIADGPTIQRSTQVALEQGVTSGKCLEMVAELRQRGLPQPLLLMGYYNPMLAYGLERFARDAAAAGASGLIVPDLPPEEANEMRQAASDAGLALPQFVAPTSPPERIRLAAERATGFLYLVSVTGVTGARLALPPTLPEFAARVRSVTGLPRAVGFGVSTPEQVRAVGKFAEGVIVGSAVIRAVEDGRDPVEAVGGFVRGLVA